MKRAESPRTAAEAAAPAEPARVSLRALYADALRDVMADPRKAIVEHDPWLAALLPVLPDAPAR